MKATVLSDNIAAGELSGEWGLSIYIEHNDKKLLLDTGASSLFAENAAKLHLPIESVDYAVLSHAHYDHADGMPRFFQLNADASFYLQDSCREKCYAKKWFFHKYIGIPKGLLKQYPDRLTFVSGTYELYPGAYLLSHSTPNLAQAGKAENMYRKTGWKWIPDDFSHEQSLVLDTPKGLVIFNSCSHGGADHIIQEVQEAFSDKNLFAIIGGFHLFNKSETYIREFAHRIRDTKISQVYTGHCTGKRAYKILEEELGSCLHQLQTGMEMSF